MRDGTNKESSEGRTASETRVRLARVRPEWLGSTSASVSPASLSKRHSTLKSSGIYQVFAYQKTVPTRPRRLEIAEKNIDSFLCCAAAEQASAGPQQHQQWLSLARCAAAWRLERRPAPAGRLLRWRSSRPAPAPRRVWPAARSSSSTPTAPARWREEGGALAFAAPLHVLPFA